MTVTPGTATLTALEAAIQLTAQVQDQYGEAISGVTVEWATSAAHVASVDAAGLVAAAANGTVTITAAADTASGTAQVTVEQMVSAVSVSPAADTLVHGDTLRFTAQGTDANGHSVAGIEFSWASSDTAVATVDARGLATGVHPGYAEIAATSAGLTARADLVVESRRPSSVSVTPDSAVLVALTDTTRLNAAVHDQLGEVMPGVEVAWASADTTVAAVDSAGLVVGPRPRLENRCSYGEVSPTAECRSWRVIPAWKCSSAEASRTRQPGSGDATRRVGREVARGACSVVVRQWAPLTS